MAGSKPPLKNLANLDAQAMEEAIDSSAEVIYALRERLREANEALVASTSMAVVGQLAAAVAHDINNPSQVLRSCLEHLVECRGRLTQADEAEVLQDALLALNRVERVTTELVPFASPASMEASSVDINSCVATGLRLAKNELRHRTHVIESLGEGLLVDGVEARLSQLLTGMLLVIARNFDEDCESNRITIRTDGDQEQVSVHFHCVGSVDKEFFTELSKRLNSWEGVQPTGSSRWISIILCQQIAVAHGGVLTVRSIEDDSADIEFCLPRSIKHKQSKLPRVLIIDDEELILRSLRRMLRAHYEVEVCTSGRQALELIAAHDYDAIVCDIMMPGLSGVSVWESLCKSNPEVCKKLAFISAGTFTEKTQQFADTTAQPVVKKPVRQAELRQVIADLIKGA